MLGLLTGLTTVAHFAALLFIGLGGFLAWYRPGVLVLHVPLACWGLIVNVLPLPCPLTLAEDHLRRMRGLAPLEGGFNEHYIYDTLFPRELLPVVGVGALVLVLVSYLGAVIRWRERRASTSAPATRAQGRPVR